ADGNAAPQPEADDVLRIEAEEPVFYIGPDTRPPQRRQTVQERIRANLQALRQPATYRRPVPRQAPPRGQGQSPIQPQPVASNGAAAPAAPRRVSASAPLPAPEAPVVPS